ncbi:response regulator transcription factor [Clostridium septicum]|uniref:Stage 0 sporulation protein A homolog n=1 Tax=Clostridium septicum TaxID=1504 RepID=A0A9N7JMG2_CLOSE|nr:response regulator transcription factor [Clostridium septicum]AYE34689.1 DNA-binding response regulator [Clostridium septicum]MDU1312805.1 response regulator transcription factor [Clostridium septicum]QAS60090.1 response regulator transcription factor [Clostridium septicum]UEC20666.1 response regulator transcription factor [Clostridium septicum]USS01283.1 response regulator transcription factor [Clostridium septicum]
MGKVLLVEDEASIRGFLKINLKRNDLKVLETDNGEDGLKIADLERPEIAILDVMLPGIDGFEVCDTLRRKYPNMGIIMLTAKSQDIDKIMGLEYGADDYIVKPFNPIEVVLRVKALLRRIVEKQNKREKLIVGNFTIDLYSQKLLKQEEEIDLTPKEYLLMKLFLENPNRAFKRDELLDLVWGENYFGDPKIIDVNIRRLRAKIEDDSYEPKYIETVWGIGYRWRV